MLLITLAIAARLVGGSLPAPCEAPGAPALDHAIIAVRDLDRAEEAFRRHGFRIKPGRLHANGLLNRHIKFRDGTELELMTVRGAPGDAMARRYADLLRAGDGGVYVALRVSDVAVVRQAADSLRLAAHRSSSGPWQFLGFPSTSTAAAVFFTSGAAPVADADSIVAHEPSVSALAEVWLEGGAELGALLRRLGAVACDAATSPDGRVGRRWALSRGQLVIVPPRGGRRPGVLGVVLTTTAQRDTILEPMRTFWIRYQPPSPPR